jgi:nitrite reductase/ring-hydroxylating ferredoxin subunit
LVNVDGSFFVVNKECTHRGGFFGEGEINGDWNELAIECPLHGSVFDGRTGGAESTGVDAGPDISVEVVVSAIKVSTD